jgi:hypothetical protein
MIRIAAISGLLVCDGLATTQGEDIDPRLLDQFQKEAPKVWEKNAKSQRLFFELNRGWRWEGNLSGFSINSEGRRSAFDQSWTKNFMGRSYISSKVVDKTKSSEELIVINPQYLFNLTRPIGSNKWVLIEVIKRDIDISSGECFESGDENLAPDSTYLYYLKNEQPIPNQSQYCPFAITKNREWFKLPELKLRAIEKVAYQENDGVKVQLTFLNRFFEPGKQASDRTYLCTAIFNPNRGWSLLRVEGSFVDSNLHPFGVSSVLVNEYASDVGGVPFRTGCDSRYFRPLGNNSNSLSSLVLEKSATSLEQLDSRDFYLRAYGFPEPDWYVPPRPWWLITSLTGMGLLIVGAIVLTVGRRIFRSMSLNFSPPRMTCQDRRLGWRRGNCKSGQSR